MVFYFSSFFNIRLILFVRILYRLKQLMLFKQMVSQSCASNIRMFKLSQKGHWLIPQQGQYIMKVSGLKRPYLEYIIMLCYVDS